MSETTRDKTIPQDRPNILRQAIFVVFYHKRLLLGVAATVFCVFFAMALFLPAKYLCQAKFSATMTEQIDPLQREAGGDTKNQYTRMLSGQKEIILSNRVLLIAAKAVYPGKTEAEYQKIIAQLAKDIDMAPPKGETFEGTNNFYLSYDDSNPERAFEMVNAVAKAYLEVYAKINKERTEFSYDFFSAQADNLAKTMAEKAEKLKEYESKHALALVDILNLEGTKSNMENGTKTLLNDAQRKRQEMQENYISLIQTIRDLDKDMSDNNAPAILPDMEGSGKTITSYRNKVAQLRMQIKEMETQFTPEYEPLRRLKEELSSNMALLRGEVDLYLRGKGIQAESIKSAALELDKSIAALETSLRETAKLRSSYEYLRNDYEIAKQAYANAKTNLERARQANSMSKPPLIVTMVDPPLMPTVPYKPNRPALVALGLFLGLFLGLSVVFLIDYFDHTIKTPEDIVRFGKLPMYGSLSHAGSR